jgi:cell division protein FtsQ
VVETPERSYAPDQVVPRRTSATPRRKLRRDLDEDFNSDFEDGFGDDESPGVRRNGGTRVKLRGLPQTLWGRIALGVLVTVGLGLAVGTALTARGMVLRDERFVIPESSAIEIEGNRHLTRAQLLSIFGGDVERNIFKVSLEDRKAQLEQLPWVSHATVMRLLPDHLRVSISERTPVAFVRQGSRIGLVDANGVLLDMPTDGTVDTHYSFPVVTGIGLADPSSTRAARMKIYKEFTTALDGGGEKISAQLSEVDLSNPEDVKALIPDKSSDILVHFGDTDFLDRYHKYQAHLAEWRTQYPKLSSVDMRYDRQVVLEMQPGSTVPAGSAGGAAGDVKPVADVKAPAVASKPVVAGSKPAGVKSPVAAGKVPTTVAKSAVSAAVHMPVVKSAAGPKSVPGVKSGSGAVTAPAPAAATAAQAKPVVVSNESYWVTSSKGNNASKGTVAKGKAGAPVVKAPAKSTSKTAAKTGHASAASHPVGPEVKQ